MQYLHPTEKERRMLTPLVDQIHTARRKRQLLVFATVGVLLVSLTHIATVVSTYL